MKKSVLKIIALLVIATQILTGCAASKPIESDEPLVSEPVNEVSQETVGSEQIQEPQKIEKIKEESDLPTKSEIELFNTIVGGFFYSNSDDKEYDIARQEAMELYNNKIIKVLEECIELQENLEFYEEQILYFVDEIDVSRTEYEEDFQYIINNMIAYKTAITTLSLQANGYFEIIEKYEKNDVNKAVIDGEIFALTMEIYSKLDEYISFLVYTSEYLGTSMDIQLDEVFADRIRGETHKSFEENVLESFVDVTKSYVDMSEIYVYIASVDYYESLIIKKEALNKFESMEQTENIKALTKILEEEKVKPDYILELDESEIEVEAVLDTNKNLLKLPFVAYADESIEDQINIKAGRTALKGMLSKIKRIEERKGEVSDEEMSIIIFEMLVATKKHKEILMAEQIEYGLPKKEKLDKIIKDIPPKKFVDVRDEIELENSQLKLEALLALETIANNMDAVEKEIISMEQREKFIKKLSDFQNSDKAFEAKTGLLIPEFLGGGTEKVYTGIISKFGEMLDKNKDKLNGEIYEQLQGLLFNDLSEILGENKFEFVNKFLNGSAEDIVNSFADWVNNSKNSGNIKIDKNTLIDLLDALGVKHVGVKDEVTEEVVEEPEEESIVEEDSDGEVKNEWDHNDDDGKAQLGTFGFSGDDSDYETAFDKEIEKTNSAGIRSVGRFSNDIQVQSTTYDKDGNFTMRLANHSNGTSIKCVYRNGSKTLETYYNESDNLIYSIDYHNDSAVKRTEKFFIDGVCSKRVIYKEDGIKNSLVIYYEDGKTRKMEYLYNESGDMRRSLEFDSDGNRINSTNY